MRSLWSVVSTMSKLDNTKLLQFWSARCSVFVIAVCSISAAVVPDDEVRFCYECSGFQCLQNPQDPSLFPGRVRCHPVMDYCTTHIRYTPPNRSLASNASLTSRDYRVTSATRACAKTWLGNTCRRDWLGKPEITCITTCDKDLCNCDSRSPPAEMFSDGRVLPLAPEQSTYSEHDMLSCRHMDGVPGLSNGNRYKSSRVDDDYSYYNDYEVMKVRRRGKQPYRRRGLSWPNATAHTINGQTQYFVLFLSAVSALLLICRPTIEKIA